MSDQSLSEQARDAVLTAIIKAAPNVGNSPAGVRDLAEAYARLERNLVPVAGVVKNKTWANTTTRTGTPRRTQPCATPRCRRS